MRPKQLKFSLASPRPMTPSRIASAFVSAVTNCHSVAALATKNRFNCSSGINNHRAIVHKMIPTTTTSLSNFTTATGLPSSMTRINRLPVPAHTQAMATVRSDSLPLVVKSIFPISRQSPCDDSDPQAAFWSLLVFVSSLGGPSLGAARN